MYCDFGALPDQLGVLSPKELSQVLPIFGLAGHRSQGFMPHNVFFLLVFKAFSDQVLEAFTPDLPNNEADLMFEQARLRLKVLTAQEAAQCFSAFGRVEVSHVVHEAVLEEEGYFLLTEESQEALLFEEVGQVE